MPTDWYSETPLESWEHFTSFIREALVYGIDGVSTNGVWFRGQGDADWSLTASFDRVFKHLTSGQKADVYDHMVKTFRERAINHDAIAKLRHEALICLMQHYGAPTRVLDWTSSPYIAAYFAFASAASLGDTDDDRQRCAIYILNAKKDIFKGFHTVKLIHQPPLENKRAAAQRGRFTLNLSAQADLIAELKQIHANAAERPSSWIVQKLSIPRVEASLAMRDLELMGVTSEIGRAHV